MHARSANGRAEAGATANIIAFVADIRRWGEFGMIPALNARRTPNRTAIVDDDGEMTFKELDDAAHAVANGLRVDGGQGRRRGGDPGPQPSLVPDLHLRRRPTGARIVLLNSEFSGPQIKECPSARAPR